MALQVSFIHCPPPSTHRYGMPDIRAGAGTGVFMQSGALIHPRWTLPVRTALALVMVSALAACGDMAKPAVGKPD